MSDVVRHANPHYLELLYHVFKHGGVTNAAPRVGYALTASAISKQLCQFERILGRPLYERRPFRLTRAGEKLLEVIKPMFDRLPAVLAEIMSDQPDTVRLAASPIIFREYLASLVRPLRDSFPEVRLVLHEGFQSQIEELLNARAIDVAVTLIERELPPEYGWEPLLRLPISLLVPRESKVRSAQELWANSRKRPTLIGPPPQNAIARYFQQGLQRLGIQWPIKHEVSSMFLVEQAVRDGLGFGMAVELVDRPIHPELRDLSLPDFPRIPLGMISLRDANAPTQALMAEVRRTADRLIKSHPNLAPE